MDFDPANLFLVVKDVENNHTRVTMSSMFEVYFPTGRQEPFTVISNCGEFQVPDLSKN